MKTNIDLLNDFLEFLTPFVKLVLETILKEKRNIHLENNLHTKANGFYERDLKMVFGQLTKNSQNKKGQI